MATKPLKRFDFWRFWGRSLMAGTDRIGAFSQHDRLVGIAVVGGIVFGPLAGGIIATVLGLAALLIPSIVLALLVLFAVLTVGAYGQWQASEDTAVSLQDETAYYKNIIEVGLDHKEKQQMHAALIEEGSALIEQIVTGGDDQIPTLRTAVDDWRWRGKEFLDEHSHRGAADGAECFRSLDRSPGMGIVFRGAPYTGDRGVFAAQVDAATRELSSMFIPEKSYLDYRTGASAADEEETTG